MGSHSRSLCYFSGENKIEFENSIAWGGSLVAIEGAVKSDFYRGLTRGIFQSQREKPKFVSHYQYKFKAKKHKQPKPRIRIKAY